MTASLPAQTHYTLPFGQGLRSGYIALVILLGICGIVLGVATTSYLALRVVVLLIIIIGPTGMVLTLLTDPSFGIPWRRSLVQPDENGRKHYYTLRPFFGRRICERTGGLHRSGFHGQAVDYNAPYVEYELFGHTFAVRWEPALLVVGW